MRIPAILTILSLVKSTLLTPKKLCINCKHFIANKEECAIFGDTNLVTGKIDYKYASSCRTNEGKCGEKALYYEENNYKFVTVPYYFCKVWWPIILVVTIYSTIFYVSINK